MDGTNRTRYADMFQMPPLEFRDILWINLLWLSFLFPVFVLFSMRRTLQLVQSEHRLCSPNDVWWCLIPFVGNALLFVVTKRIAKSLYRQFDDLGQHDLFREFGFQPIEDYGAAKGLYWSVLCIVNNFFWLYLFVRLDHPLDFLKIDSSVICCTFLITLEAVGYWLSISHHRHILVQLLNPAKSAEESDFHDDREGGRES